MLKKEILSGDKWAVEAIHDTWQDGLLVEPHFYGWSKDSAKEMCKAIEDHMNLVKRNYIVVSTTTPKLVNLLAKISGFSAEKVPLNVQGYEIYVLEKV